MARVGNDENRVDGIGRRPRPPPAGAFASKEPNSDDHVAHAAGDAQCSALGKAVDVSGWLRRASEQSTRRDTGDSGDARDHARILYRGASPGRVSDIRRCKCAFLNPVSTVANGPTSDDECTRGIRFFAA
jgi:hypothetical protein